MKPGILVLEDLLCEVGSFEVRRAPPAPSRERKALRSEVVWALHCGWGGGVGGGPPPHFFGATPVSDPSSKGSDLAAHNHVQKCSGFPAAAIRWRDLFGAPNPPRRARGARGSLLSFPHLKSAVRNLPHPYGRCRKPRAQVCGPGALGGPGDLCFRFRM